MTDDRATALAELIPAMQTYLEIGEAIAAALKAQELPFALPQAAARSVHSGLVKLAAAEILARAPATAEGVAKRLAGLAAPAKAAA